MNQHTTVNTHETVPALDLTDTHPTPVAGDRNRRTVRDVAGEVAFTREVVLVVAS